MNKKKKLLLITFNTRTPFMAERIVKEARLRGIECSVVLWKELVFDLTGKEARIRTKKGDDIRAYDIVWPRNPQPGSYM